MSEPLFVIPFLRGGLGNQLFQIAAALGYEEKYGHKTLIDLSNFACRPISHHTNYLYFNIFIHGLSFDRAKNVLTYLEKASGVYTPIPLAPLSVNLNGYFQTPLYFPKRETLMKHFYLIPERRDQMLTKYQDLLAKNTVAVHVRRGDYIDFLTPSEHERVDRFMTETLDQASKDLVDPVFVIITNDKPYVKAKYPDYIVIDEPYDYLEFFIMMMCRHHIVSNSTFAFWAMYLTPHVDGHNYIIRPWLTIFKGSDDLYKNLDHLTNLKVQGL